MSELPLVRIAMPSDEAEIMTMCHDLHEENGLFDFNENKVRGCLQRCYAKQGAIVGVIGEPGEIKASTCLLISDMYYTSQWHLAELWNYVKPQYRKGTDNAVALIEFGKKCADTIGIPLITGIITNKRLAEKVRLYRRRLGYPSGAFFIYGARWVGSEPSHEDFWGAGGDRSQHRKYRAHIRQMNGTAHVR